MKHALVIGAGISGYGAAKFLRKKGFVVSVSERNRLGDKERAPFLECGVRLLDGGHDEAHLEGVDVVVCSPGVPPSLPILVAVRAKGLELLSEIDLVLSEYDGCLIGVTGTNGKSTTVSMISHLLSKFGIEHSLAGNIGDPPTLQAAEGRLASTLVLELSSYQLASSRLLRCDVAVWTSFTPDHLAYHGTMEAYFQAKARLFEGLKRSGRAILHSSIAEFDQKFVDRLPQPDRWTVKPSTDGAVLQQVDGTVTSWHLDGFFKHDRLNAAFAALACAPLTNACLADLAAALKDFRTLAHRCERMHLPKAWRAINDSKATNVDSTLTALAAVAGPLHLLLGGAGKGESFLPILDFRDKIKEVVAFGAEGEKIESEIGKSVPVVRFSSLAEAIDYGADILRRGDDTCLLLSPGCASFDEFKNFEHRGTFFKERLTQLLGSLE